MAFPLQVVPNQGRASGGAGKNREVQRSSLSFSLGALNPLPTEASKPGREGGQGPLWYGSFLEIVPAL